MSHVGMQEIRSHLRFMHCIKEPNDSCSDKGILATGPVHWGSTCNWTSTLGQCEKDTLVSYMQLGKSLGLRLGGTLVFLGLLPMTILAGGLVH
jgi:hypothetical protein